MNVLVFGGSGWIGSYTVKQLEDNGHEVITYDLRDGLDIRDSHKVDTYVSYADHVISLSGKLGTHELLDAAYEAVEINVLGALNITMACAKHDVGLTQITLPRVNPSLYSATKCCAMDISEVYRQSHGLRVSYTKAYNAFGISQLPPGNGHPQKIIPTFATYAWANKPIPVWGDGSLWTDIVHVEDVARMLVDTMDFGDGQVFDAGTGQPQTVLAVANRVLEITGSTAGIEHLPVRKGERLVRTGQDYAGGEGWDLLDWRPRFDDAQLVETVMSYKP